MSDHHPTPPERNRDWPAIRRLSRLQAEVRRLEAALKGYQARYYATAAQLQRTARELEEIRRSKAWRWALRARRLRHELIAGTWAQRRAYASDIVGKLLRLGRQAQPAPTAQVAQQRDLWFEGALDEFLQRAAAAPSEWVYFIFAGSAFIQEHRGHRLMGITRVLRQRGVPVFYSYHPWVPNEPIPRPGDPLLFQSPIHKTLAAQSRVVRHDFGDKKRVYLLGFPHPFCARSVGEVSSLGWITHYDCLDEWEEFHKEGAAPWYDEAAERAAVCFCDVVTATARALVAKMQGYTGRKTVHLSPNALSSSFLQPEMAARTAPRQGPLIIGYVGHLGHWWFDWQALGQIARRMPDCRFEIIGFGGPEDVKVPSNVRLLGPKNHAEINRIAQRWRAAMVLRKISPLTAAMDSLKVYEYLALGLPMVCFTMPQIERYPYVYSAPDVEGFCEQAHRAARDPLDRQVIDAFLLHSRWEDRVDQFLRLAQEAHDSPPLLGGLQDGEPPA